MSMSDIVSALERTGPTQLALIAFTLAFIAIVIRLFTPDQRRTHERDAVIPLEEAPVAAPGASDAGRKNHAQA